MTRRQRRRGGGVEGRRCLAAGCERRVQPGRALCREHGRSAAGPESAARGVQGAVARLLDDLGEGERSALRETGRRGDGETLPGQASRREDRGRDRRAEAFLGRVARGDYGGLLDEPVRRVIGEAAKERSLELEIGALRLILIRVLTEEADPVRQALGATRVTRALAGLVRQHGEQTGNAHDQFSEFLRRLYVIDPEMTEDEQFDDAMGYAEEHFGAELEAHFGGGTGVLEAGEADEGGGVRERAGTDEAGDRPIGG